MQQEAARPQRSRDAAARPDGPRAAPRLSAVHVIDGLLVQHGGPSYTVPSLAKALAELGVDVKLRTVAPEPARQPQASNFQHTLHEPAGFFAPALRASNELKRILLQDARSGAILHAHCLWLMPNIYPAWARRRAGGNVRLVHSVRGMLSPEALRISRWKKLPFWWLYQRSALRTADCLHATADAEYEEIRQAGLKNPVAVIPNAVELPDLSGAGAHETKRERKVLSLGRLHPKKGLEVLVRAWSVLEPDHPDWRLQIVGSPELGYDETLRTLASSLGCKRVTIEGPVYDEEKIAAYRSAELFALSSLNENFAITVAEALAAETPVVATKGAPWAGLETQRCGWWVDQGVEPLVEALRTALSLSSEERRAMGARGRAWISEAFSWPGAAADMLDVYQWLRFGGEPPPTVRLL